MYLLPEVRLPLMCRKSGRTCALGLSMTLVDSPKDHVLSDGRTSCVLASEYSRTTSSEPDGRTKALVACFGLCRVRYYLKDQVLSSLEDLPLACRPLSTPGRRPRCRTAVRRRDRVCIPLLVHQSWSVGLRALCIVVPHLSSRWRCGPK